MELSPRGTVRPLTPANAFSSMASRSVEYDSRGAFNNQTHSSHYYSQSVLSEDNNYEALSPSQQYSRHKEPSHCSNATKQYSSSFSTPDSRNRRQISANLELPRSFQAVREEPRDDRPQNDNQKVSSLNAGEVSDLRTVLTQDGGQSEEAQLH